MNLSHIKKNKTLKSIFEILVFVIGAVIFSVGISVFIKPGNISVGGFTGVSIILNHLFNSPVGVVIIVLNIPMFIICSKIFGIKFIIKTIIGVFLTSIFIDLFAFIQPFHDLRPELNALFGGVLQGVGLGLVYMNGFTTGGADLVLWLLKLKFPHLTSGFILFILDSFVVVTAAIIFNNAEAILYSAIAIFSYTKVLDTILVSNDRANFALIISDKYDTIADDVTKVLGRSVTVFDGKGWFTKESKTIILCVVDRSQLYNLRKIITENDPSAFFILTDAREVIGLGFKDINKKV